MQQYLNRKYFRARVLQAWQIVFAVLADLHSAAEALSLGTTINISSLVGTESLQRRKVLDENGRRLDMLRIDTYTKFTSGKARLKAIIDFLWHKTWSIGVFPSSDKPFFTVYSLFLIWGSAFIGDDGHTGRFCQFSLVSQALFCGHEEWSVTKLNRTVAILHTSRLTAMGCGASIENGEEGPFVRLNKSKKGTVLFFFHPLLTKACTETLHMHVSTRVILT